MVANQYFARYPVIQVRPYGLLVYERTEWFIKKRKEDREPANHNPNRFQNKADGKVKSYTGKLSPYARKKLKRSIQLLVASSVPKEAPNFKNGKLFKFKVNFITLTLPASQGQISDKTLKSQCLDNFIKRCKRKYKLKSYVWRAERQGNGNLHFHIITDCYIHYEKMRNDWNSCLHALGFIDRFKEKNGHSNPNSTDIHAITGIKNLTQYFCKYMAKDELTQEKAMNIPHKSHSYKMIRRSKHKLYLKACKTEKECLIEGKVWDCSKNLKVKKNCELLLESEVRHQWETALNDPEVKTVGNNIFTILLCDDQQFNKYVVGTLRERWLEYLAMIRGDMAA